MSAARERASRHLQFQISNLKFKGALTPALSRPTGEGEWVDAFVAIHLVKSSNAPLVALCRETRMLGA